MFITSKTVEAHKACLRQHTNNNIRSLYPYQLMIVEAMRQMEQGQLASSAEMFFCGPRGSTVARFEALVKGKKLERNIVRTIPHAGILTSRTGTGKTACIIELLARPQKPPTNTSVRQTCLGQVELQQIFVPVDICVVPGNIFSQWRSEFEILGQTGYWKFVSTTADVESTVDIFNTYRTDKNVPLQPHILISDTMYERLLKAQFDIVAEEFGEIVGLEEEDDRDERDEWDEENNEENEDEHVGREALEAETRPVNFNYRSFPHMFRVRRVIIDECDSLNFKMLWADFIWYVSATFKLFLQKCISGGTGKNTHSLLGELKQGTYIYSAYQLRKLFCITISKKVFEDTLAPNELPDFKGRSIMYEGQPGQYMTRQDFLLHSWNHVKKQLYKISESLAQGSFAVAFYNSIDTEFVEQMRADFDSKSNDKVSYILVNNTKTYTSKRIQQILTATKENEIRSGEPTIVFVISVQFLAQGLNLQQAKCAIILNDLDETKLIQVVGRVQRRGRKSQLTIYRIWAPDERLLYPPFNGMFLKEYTEIKNIMARKKWRIETDKEVQQLYHKVLPNMDRAYYEILNHPVASRVEQQEEYEEENEPEHINHSIPLSEIDKQQQNSNKRYAPVDTESLVPVPGTGPPHKKTKLFDLNLSEDEDDEE